MTDISIRVYGNSAGARSALGSSPDLLDDVLTFEASPDHASVTSYELIVYEYGTTTEATSVNIGKPTPDGNNDISYDCTALFSTLATGNYTLVVNTISAGGETESAGVHFYHAA